MFIYSILLYSLGTCTCGIFARTFTLNIVNIPFNNNYATVKYIEEYMYLYYYEIMKCCCV